MGFAITPMGIFRLFKSRPAKAVPNVVRGFLAALKEIAPPAGMGAYALKNADGGCHGFIQFVPHTPASLIIHRLWTLEPGKGNGAAVLGLVCELADRHGVELRLRLETGIESGASAGDS